MVVFQVRLLEGHLFLTLEDGLWLVDTGSPASFGGTGGVCMVGSRFQMAHSHAGLDAGVLSGLVGVPCAGLLGADILNRFDILFDVAAGNITLAESEILHEGPAVGLDAFMGIPIVVARIGGGEHRMFLDTGAQVSYFQPASLGNFPPLGTVDDFYPGFGKFATETHEVPVEIGARMFHLRCGRLPGLLGMTLALAGADGIIGNAILLDRVVGYFPRRGLLVL